LLTEPPTGVASGQRPIAVTGDAGFIPRHVTHMNNTIVIRTSSRRLRQRRCSMALTTPEVLWFNGAVVPWVTATVHIWSETSARGANVFEGIRAYWDEETRTYHALSLPEHLHRLAQSARLLRFPDCPAGARLTDGMGQLLAALDFGEHAYLRPTLFLDDAHGQGAGATDADTGAYILCFRAPRPADPAIRCGVSTWRRPSDLTLSPRIKSGGGFLGLRLARIEATERGFADVIMLNAQGTVAEATGANVFVIRGGVAITPPVTAGILEGITRARLLDLVPGAVGVPVAEREIGRSELYAAEEIFLCSTLHEIQPVVEIDGFTVGDGKPGPVTSLIREWYLRHCEAGPRAPAGWLTPLTAAAPLVP
jgi:branched-chain amino acid aminotransferase